MTEQGRRPGSQAPETPGETNRRAGSAPSGWDAAAVAAVWSEVLDGPPVQPQDDLFFDLGGNSLLAVAITARLAERTGLPLELRDLYLAPTPDELAAYLAELRSRLTDLRSRPDDRGWSPEAFAEALADLGAAAADSLLPAEALVSLQPGGPDAVGGAARIAVLRKARGNGTCVVKPGPVLTLARQDATVAVHIEQGASDLVVRLVEADPGPLRAADAD